MQIVRTKIKMVFVNAEHMPDTWHSVDGICQPSSGHALVERAPNPKLPSNLLSICQPFSRWSSLAHESEQACEALRSQQE